MSSINDDGDGASYQDATIDVANGSETSFRKRSRRQDDVKLARSIAAARAVGRRPARGGRERRGTGYAMPSTSSTSGSSRLRFLLSILLVTTLLLLLLQTFRHLRSGSNNSLQGRMTRARAALLQKAAHAGGDTATPVSWSARLSNAIAAAANSDSSVLPSGSAVAEQRRKRIEEQDAPPVDWRNYIAAMRQHFDDELARMKRAPGSSDTTTNGGDETSSDGRVSEDATRIRIGGSGGGGMAVVPGESVRDHLPMTGSKSDHAEQQKPAPVPGKSEEEAEEDRKVVLEDLDQETIKAMFDALYGRGG